MNKYVVIIVLVVALGMTFLSLVNMRQQRDCALAKAKAADQMTHVVAQKSHVDMLKRDANSRDDKYVVPFGATTYSVSNKDPAAVAFANRHTKEIAGNAKIFAGASLDYPFATVLIRVADFGFISESKFRSVIRLLTLAQKQNIKVVGRSSFRDEPILVIARSK